MEHNQDQLLTESEAGAVMGGGAQGLREPPLTSRHCLQGLCCVPDCRKWRRGCRWLGRPRIPLGTVGERGTTPVIPGL